MAIFPWVAPTGLGQKSTVYSHKLTVPAGGIIPDVLMVEGGGQGGYPQGGGGDGGAVLYGQHIFIPQGVYSLSVASSVVVLSQVTCKQTMCLKTERKKTVLIHATKKSTTGKRRVSCILVVHTFFL